MIGFSVLLTKEGDYCVTYGICRLVRAFSSVIEVPWLVPELESRLERSECSKSETTNHHRKKKEAQRTSLLFHREYSNKTEVLASSYINERYSLGLTEFRCCTWTSLWTERECWHVCALCTLPCPASQCWTGWRPELVLQSSTSQWNWCLTNNWKRKNTSVTFKLNIR